MVISVLRLLVTLARASDPPKPREVIVISEHATGVFVGGGMGVFVGIGVSVGVLVGKGVFVGVLVGRGVFVDVLVAVGVRVLVGVVVGVAVCVGVPVGVGLGPGVGVDGSSVAVGDGVMVSVPVEVAVLVASSPAGVPVFAGQRGVTVGTGVSSAPLTSVILALRSGSSGSLSLST
ncbi:MAG: hypothetical protein PVF70_08960 [Anaerolineales bacterium]|jgi:hypothetical protein